MLVPAALLHIAIQTVLNNPSPFEWASQHIHLVTWPVIVWLVARATWMAGKFFQQAKHQVETTVTQINTMATNHFPHMERSLINMDKNITRLTAHTTGDADIVEN